MDVDEPAAEDIDLANAVNLSESEDEVEEERIAGDFFIASEQDLVRACSTFPAVVYRVLGFLGSWCSPGQNLPLSIPTKLPHIRFVVACGCYGH